jgi:uncharacterized protein YecE (DUF72 family)
MRRHGPDGGKYRGGYSRAALRRDARRVGKWMEQGKSVYVFFNNDVGGHAFRDAQTLQSMLLRPA